MESEYKYALFNVCTFISLAIVKNYSGALYQIGKVHTHTWIKMNELKHIFSTAWIK